MEFHPRHDRWRVGTNDVLVLLNKLLVMCMAWLFFFYLVMAGWDLDAQQEQPLSRSPFGNYEPAPHYTPKGGIEK